MNPRNPRRKWSHIFRQRDKFDLVSARARDGIARSRPRTPPHTGTLNPASPAFAIVGRSGTNVERCVVPAKTPREIVDKLHADLVRVLMDPDNKPRFNAIGIEAVHNTPER